MASTDHKKFKTTASSKGAGVDVHSESVVLPPDSEDHVLTVTADSSCTGEVDVQLEMSPDGNNWCPAVTRTVSVTPGTTTSARTGNEEYVKLTPDAGEFKNKHCRGGLNFNTAGAVVTPDGSGARDLMHQHIATTKSFNYSQWFKTSENPTTTYKPVLFRHGGYDNFSNAKTLELGTGVGYVNNKYLKGAAIHELGGLYKETSGGLMSEGTTHNNYGTDPVTINFWAYIPSSIASGEATLLGDHASLSTGRSIFINSSNQLVLYSNNVVEYRYAGFTLSSDMMNKWVMITVVLDSDTITNAKFYVQTNSTTNTTAITNTITTGATISTYPDNGSTINHSGFLGCRQYNGSKYPASSSGLTSTEFKIDEYTAWGKALSASEITSLHNSHKAFDYSTHSASSDLFRYIRFGDLTGDSNSTVNCKIDASYDLAKDSGSSGTYVNSLTEADVPYLAPPNQNLCNASAASAENAGAIEATSGNAYDLRGVLVQDDSTFDLTDEIWSYGFWFKSNTNIGSGNLAQHGGNNSSGAAYTRHLLASTYKASSNFYGGFAIQVADNADQSTYPGSGMIVEFVENGSKGHFERVTYDVGASLYDGNWHHMLVVRETAAPTPASSTGFKIYIDGSLVSTTFSTFGGGAPTFSSITDKATIVAGQGHKRDSSGNLLAGVHGARYYASSFLGVGKIDNACFWKSDQSSNASTIYNSGKPLTTNPGTPTSYLRFEDSSNLDTNSVTGSTVSTDTSDYTTLNVQQEVLTEGSDSIFIAGLPTLNTHFSTTAGLSISGWFKTTDTGMLFSNSSDGTDGLLFDIQSSVYQLKFGSTVTIQGASSDLKDGEWHHLLITKAAKDGSNNSETKIYLDGVLKSTTSVGSNLSDSDLRGTNGFTLLGDGQKNANSTSTDKYDTTKLNANLSNWSIHSEALNANAALQLYSNGHVRNIKNLPDVTAASIKAWWQMADTSNPQNDVSGNNAHLLYQYALNEVANTKYITGGDGTSTTLPDWELSGSNKNVFTTDSSNIMAINDPWSISMDLDFPRTTGTGKYRTFFSMFTNLPTTGAGIQLVHYRTTGSSNFQVLRIGISDGTNYWLRDYQLSNPANEFGHLVVVKNTGTFGASTDPFTVYWEGSDISSTGNTISHSNSSSLSWSGQTVDDVHLSSYHKYLVANNQLSKDPGLRKIDNVSCYPSALTSAQVSSLYNSSSYYDPNLISGATAIFRMGDGPSDGSDEIFDTKDTTRKFVKGGSGSETIVDLAGTDNIYTPGFTGPGPLLSSLVTATGAPYVNGSINGNALTLSLTKSFDFTTNKWVSTADKDLALCLSLNGFEEQAEYFAIWKCAQTVGGQSINICDGDWHNVILSYRGKNNLSGDNVDPGDTVKFGPGPANSLAFNWAVSFDGQPLTSLNDGSGADFIGGLNTIVTDTYNATSYNVGFAIQDRHLKYISTNSEEVYKPHAQFSAGIHEVSGVDNNNAFQGSVDETSFHSDDWWVDQAGTSIITNTYNQEKPATIYGNTTALGQRQGATTDYPEGKPYDLLHPERLTTSGQASDIEGTNQYINPNRYDSGTNPNGGLEGWWRWGDTPGDCSITINDVKDHNDSINARDISAFGIVTADRVDMSAQGSPESIYITDRASSTSAGSASISFPQVIVENIQSGVCNLKDMVSPVLQYLRVKFTGSGSCDLGEGKAQAQINFTKRRKR